MPRLSRLTLLLLLIPSTMGQTQTSQPQMSNPTLATVGNVKITQSMIDERMNQFPAELPPEKRREMQTMILKAMTYQILAGEYFQANNVQYTQDDVAEVQRQQEQMTRQNPTVRPPKLTKEELENWARYIRLQQETASPEKIDELIKTHPNYFNGTKVCGSHILIRCHPLATTRRQKAAKNKLIRLQTDIRAGQITFADAARQYSDCPSKEKGGNLGEFSFSDMVPSFARAAYDAKVGDVTDIVRTEHGFHLIQVTARSEGTSEPGPQARAQAARLLLTELQNRIFDQALTTVPIVTYKNATAATQKSATPEQSK